MRVINILALCLIFFSFQSIFAQYPIYFDMLDVKNLNTWTTHNRSFSFERGHVMLDARPGDGFLYCKGFDFHNVKIEVDIKGKNEQGKSFVGIAFNGVNDSTYDVIYFRPFNFKNPERNGHSVQYISHPQYTWYNLRENFPMKYEQPVVPVPDPDEWFHATIEVKDNTVKVFVNDSSEPSLIVNQLSTTPSGWLGFWVGHNSEGQFKNLRVFSN